MKSFLSIVLLLPVTTIWSARTCPADVVIADSAVDFSGIQGQDNWYYGLYDGDGPNPFSSADFEQFPQYGGGSFGNDYWYTGNDTVGGFWTNIRAVVMHPNGPVSADGRQHVLHWSVRRWVSEVAGLVSISGNIADSFALDGDGVIGRVIVDGNEVYSATINDGNSIGTNYSFSTLVSIGSFVDFAVDPRANDYRDHTPFTAIISVPEPTGVMLCVYAIALLTTSRTARRR